MAKKEVHNAIVTRNTDDDLGTNLRGGIFFNAPTLYEGEYPLPAFPCYQFASAPGGAGLFMVPKVDDEVEIEITVDDPNTPFDTSDAELPEPRWRCMVYSDAADIAEEFKVRYPFRMGWKTNSGHLLMFDDVNKFREVLLMHTIGHALQMTNFNNDIVEKAVRLDHADGHYLQFVNKDNGSEIFMKLFHAVGNLLHFDKDGNWFEKIIKDKTEEVAENFLRQVGGDSTEEVGGKKTINVTGDCEIICANATIQASGNINATAGGNAVVMASQIQLNGSASEATSKQSHQGVIDLITGAPLITTNTVFLDA